MRSKLLIGLAALVSLTAPAFGQSYTTDADEAQFRASVDEYKRTGDPTRMVLLVRSYCQRGVPKMCGLSDQLEQQLLAEGKRVPPRAGATAAASPATRQTTPTGAATTGSAGGATQGEDATRCITSRMGRAGVVLVNSCPYVVEVAWCTENVDCSRGKYMNQWTIGANSTWDTKLGKPGDTTRIAACKGRNTLSTNGTQPFSWRHFCRKAS